MEGALKRAKETGFFNLASRNVTVFPADLCKFAELQIIEKFWEGFDLSKIDLSNNQIPEVPEELAS